MLGDTKQWIKIVHYNHEVITSYQSSIFYNHACIYLYKFSFILQGLNLFIVDKS